MADKYTIVARNGHFEVYDERDEFVFSADTYSECKYDIEELFSLSAINS